MQETLAEQKRETIIYNVTYLFFAAKLTKDNSSTMFSAIPLTYRETN